MKRLLIIALCVSLSKSVVSQPEEGLVELTKISTCTEILGQVLDDYLNEVKGQDSVLFCWLNPQCIVSTEYRNQQVDTISELDRNSEEVINIVVMNVFYPYSALSSIYNEQAKGYYFKWEGYDVYILGYIHVECWDDDPERIEMMITEEMLNLQGDSIFDDRTYSIGRGAIKRSTIERIDGW